MRSRPSTVNPKPHTFSNIQNCSRAHDRAMPNCVRYGDQKHNVMNPPNASADTIMNAVKKSDLISCMRRNLD
jgi:hypothetical protein